MCPYLVPLALPMPKAWGQKALRSNNVREQCRAELAGLYLELYDQKEVQRHFVQTNQITLEKLDLLIKEASTELKKLGVENRSVFDLAKATRRDELNSRLAQLADQRDEYKALIQQAQEKERSAAEDERKLRVELEKVFRFERMDDMPDGGYPIRLNYRGECPKYRSLCPLSERETKALSQLKLPNSSLPQSCERYLSVSRLSHRKKP